MLQNLVVDYHAADTEEGRDCKERDVSDNQEELLQERLVLHQILGLVREVDFGVDFPDDQQGAENGGEKSWLSKSIFHPEVEQQKKLEG